MWLLNPTSCPPSLQGCLTDTFIQSLLDSLCSASLQAPRSWEERWLRQGAGGPPRPQGTAGASPSTRPCRFSHWHLRPGPASPPRSRCGCTKTVVYSNVGRSANDEQRYRQDPRSPAQPIGKHAQVTAVTRSPSPQTRSREVGYRPVSAGAQILGSPGSGRHQGAPVQGMSLCALGWFSISGGTLGTRAMGHDHSHARGAMALGYLRASCILAFGSLPCGSGCATAFRVPVASPTRTELPRK